MHWLFITDSLNIFVDLLRVHFLRTTNSLDTNFVPVPYGIFGSFWIFNIPQRHLGSQWGYEQVEKGRRRRAMDLESLSIMVERVEQGIWRSILGRCVLFVCRPGVPDGFFSDRFIAWWHWHSFMTLVTRSYRSVIRVTPRVHQLLRYPNRPLGMRDPSRLHAGM